ncbi:Putative lethal giant larvae (Lgl)-like domain, WD40/YVTN repeat-like-containing domain superfamily [Septoria linicola]|uniref:Lethal giant larvae (Lgl)-like domain, WD40/YVTN repeat-like-containing domain superfamily n=1 Tax=Septoria linicola TaxID=215465 RepID=A0A9Q9B8D6_9PEZI|nr:putative lethal giant larvae (Lgl)-like domain, WD40/YVTN repeat-like-containing domain superfamily [Septoria linicola]USW59187.1 Putative lethal giant larvae (Lgl)-like domain, WD40/YVTN repeat-like-containing domain superfamily [Septoria linicola]
MAHLLRGKQAGIQNDLSAGLRGELFAVDDLARYGVNSQVSALAYDPVQSLLAVGTKSSQFGPGQIYLYGQGRIQAVLPVPARGASIQTLQFCAEKLVCLDSKHDVCVYSIELKRLISSHSPMGAANVLCTDPMLDYAFLGMQSGDVVAYDMDREGPAPFKIPNLWQDFDPKARIATVVSLQLHPRDIGTLLIGYKQGAVIYSFKLNKALRFFQYEVPRGAPGGDSDPTASNIIRRPHLTHAVWHPTGTFIMTGHEDSSIVFWDTLKDGRMLMARTLTDTNVASPGVAAGSMGDRGTFAVKEPLFKMSWCANGQDPEDTMVLVAGGQSTQAPTKGLTLFEMGRTPVYATSTWETFVNYLDSPKRQRILPTPPGAEVIEYCLIPRTSPHFAGAHDPIAVIALLSSGEMLSLSFPSGMPISPTNQLHVSLTFVHPYIHSMRTAQVGRERWLGLTERRQQGPPILTGGAEEPRQLRRYEDRNIVHAIHADGTIRLWDPGYGDEIENEKLLQVDVARALGRWDNVQVTVTSFAGASGELAAGLRSGEFIVFRWANNSNAGREPPAARPASPGTIVNISDRMEPSLSEGLGPHIMVDQKDGPATAVGQSEIGFTAAAFEGGSIILIDLRGPAIILKTTVQEFSKAPKGGSIRRRASSAGTKPEWATALAFSIMTLDGDDYSSIALHVGTNLGNLATFKIVPDPSGRYTTQFAGRVSLSDTRVMQIAPINADTGKPATASQTVMGNLRSGLKVNGALVALTPTNVHIFKPANSKGAHKSFDNYFCDAAGIIRYQDQGHALLGLFGDGRARAYAMPSLREIASIDLTNLNNTGVSIDVKRLGNAAITPTGNILAFTGPSELALLNIFGTGETMPRRQDKLFNPDRLIPPRPTISTVQWLTGTQYLTPSDMDILIGGPDRPPSKRMIAQAKADEEQRRQAGRSSAAAANVGQQDEGYWAYMQRQLAERTEKLGLVGDNMEALEQNSSNWLNDVNKFVGRQKRNAAGGIIKAKFGF